LLVPLQGKNSRGGTLTCWEWLNYFIQATPHDLGGKCANAIERMLGMMHKTKQKCLNKLETDFIVAMFKQRGIRAIHLISDIVDFVGMI